MQQLGLSETREPKIKVETKREQDATARSRLDKMVKNQKQGQRATCKDYNCKSRQKNKSFQKVQVRSMADSGVFHTNSFKLVEKQFLKSIQEGPTYSLTFVEDLNGGKM